MDTSFGQGGRLDPRTGAVLEAIADGDGVAFVAGGSLARLDARGAIDGGGISTPTPRRLARFSDGTFVTSNERGILSLVDRAAGKSSPFAPAVTPLAPWATLEIAGDVVTVVGTVKDKGFVVQKITRAGAAVTGFTPTFGGETDLRLESAATAADGSVYVLASRGFTPAVVRFDATGKVDTAFGTGGTLVLTAFGPRYARAILASRRGDVVVLGMTGQSTQLARLDAQGVVASFGAGGVAAFPFPVGGSSGARANVEARMLTEQDDGKLLVGLNWSESLESDAPQGIHVLRVTSDGRADDTFGAKGWSALLQFGDGNADAYVSSYYGAPRTMVVQGTRLVLGGAREKTAAGGFVAVQL